MAELTRIKQEGERPDSSTSPGLEPSDEEIDVNEEYDGTKTFVKSERRKARKVKMERLRRGRINKCLENLKEMLSGYYPNQLGPTNELDKAQILEMTVTHLRSSLMTPPPAPSSSSPIASATAGSSSPETTDQAYRAGYSYCQRYLRSLLSSSTEVPYGVSSRLLQHLSQGRTTWPGAAAPARVPQPSPVQFLPHAAAYQQAAFSAMYGCIATPTTATCSTSTGASGCLPTNAIHRPTPITPKPLSQFTANTRLNELASVQAPTPSSVLQSGALIKPIPLDLSQNKFTPMQR